MKALLLSFTFVTVLAQTPVAPVLGHLAIILLLIILHALLVAAESALSKVRTTQIEPLAKEGRKSAERSLRITDKLDEYLSAIQLGLTASTLGLGWYASTVLMSALRPLLATHFPQVSSAWLFGLVIGIAFASIAILHIVLGELVPRGLGTSKPLGAILWLSRPLHWFYVLTKPLVYIINHVVRWALQSIFKIKPLPAGEIAPSTDDLRSMVTGTTETDVTETERKILVNTLDLSDLEVRQVMTPRNEVVWLDINKPFQENWDIARRSKHTRFPVVDGHLDHTIGIVNIKDLIGLHEADDQELKTITMPFRPVLEYAKVDKLLGEFLKQNTHFSVVVDEYGGAVGVVALEDMLEEVVGDIRDEFDEEHEATEFFRHDDDSFTVLGTLGLHEMKDLCGIELETPDVTTIGGYVTQVLGRLPKQGEALPIQGFRASVVEADSRRVIKMLFERQDEEDESESPGNESKDVEYETLTESRSPSVAES